MFITTDSIDGDDGVKASLKSSEHGHDIFGSVEVESKFLTADVYVHTTSSIDKDSPTRSVAFGFQRVDDGRNFVPPVPHQRLTVARDNLAVWAWTGISEVKDARWHFDIADQVAVWQQLFLGVSKLDTAVSTYDPGRKRILHVLIVFPE